MISGSCFIQVESHSDCWEEGVTCDFSDGGEAHTSAFAVEPMEVHSPLHWISHRLPSLLGYLLFGRWFLPPASLGAWYGSLEYRVCSAPLGPLQVQQWKLIDFDFIEIHWVICLWTPFYIILHGESFFSVLLDNVYLSLHPRCRLILWFWHGFCCWNFIRFGIHSSFIMIPFAVFISFICW